MLLKYYKNIFHSRTFAASSNVSKQREIKSRLDAMKGLKQDAVDRMELFASMDLFNRKDEGTSTTISYKKRYNRIKQIQITTFCP